MPEAAAVGAAGEPAAGMDWVGIAWRVLVMYMVMNYFMSPSKTNDVVVAPLGTDGVVDTAAVEAAQAKSGTHFCVFSPGTPLTMQLYLEEGGRGGDYALPAFVEEHLLWTERLILGEEKKLARNFEVPLTSYLLNNGSVSLVAVLGREETFAAQSRDPADYAISRYELVKYKLQKKFVEKVNLITGEMNAPDLSIEAVGEEEERKIVSFWKPNITVNLVNDFKNWKVGSIPPQMTKHMRFHQNGRGYYPIVYFNDFWLLDEHLMPINDTLDVLTVGVEFETLSSTWWMLYDQLGESLRMQLSFGSSESDVDDIKRMLFETNPWLLGLTVVVSLLHTVFDVLAFKNDISFWKNKKSFEGMSVRSIFLNVIMQAIVFLYLLDNDTSFMILASSFVGIIIEAWKITRAVNVSVRYYKGTFPYLHFEDKHSYESETKEYDRIAFKWLSIALVPLLLGYSVYSVYYESHKSWYSWVINTLVGFVYTFGFIMMTPQLFINYKLKSVAHLPWRAFTYKALNTFVDDLFAFIIKMPTMHRLACFRDDLVFFIYLYQRWAYRVDKTRMNEFGGVSEPDKEGEAVSPAGASAETAASRQQPTSESKKDK